MSCFSLSCSENQPVSTISNNGFFIEEINDKLNFLCLKNDSVTDKWELPYEVYQLEEGDVDEDGVIDALVGVIKPTRFDTTLNKRLFIFKNYKGSVRPLWLGSKMPQPLINFTYVQHNNKSIIRTIELEKSGNYLVAEYKWRKFGLEFIKYVEREVDMISAEQLLKL